MAKFYLKDWHGKEQEFTDEKIFVRGENGELIQFTQGEGASPDVRYVTFMSYDGLTEYGKKAVAVGDDCADPIARGVFATPTRESDVQYNYTFYGWATEPNGAADSNWNKAITEDKVVYANFAAAVRYYTITYYDSDGTTVLKTESLAYGATPSYTPTKDGYSFKGWTPALEEVTGSTSYTADWNQQIDFNACSWATIAEYAQSGEAASVFKIGDTKTFATPYSGDVTVKIIGFNHDNLAGGTGKAGITLAFENSCSAQRPLTAIQNSEYGARFQESTSSTRKWDDCSLRGHWNTNSQYYMLGGHLPTDLVSVIKQVSKKVVYANTEYVSNDYLWLPSLSELGFTDGQDEGACYEAYTSGKVLGKNYAELVKSVLGTARQYLTRSKYTAGTNVLGISSTGSRTTLSQNVATAGTFPHFCI